MSPLDLTRLSALMERNSGLPEIKIALIDGPVASGHPDFGGASIHALDREFPGKPGGACRMNDSLACLHGTLVAGILVARRGSSAPAICPGCVLLVIPIFVETPIDNGQMPSATPEELAESIVVAVNAGARVINLSSDLVRPTPKSRVGLLEALNYAAHRGAMVVAAAGNRGIVGSSAITSHQWVIPVAACDVQGRPLGESNLGGSLGRRGLSAPGENVVSLGTNGKSGTFSGTSAAVPFVTGAIALLWSEFPRATAGEIRRAVTGDILNRRNVIPPVLDAWAAYRAMASAYPGRRAP